MILNQRRVTIGFDFPNIHMIRCAHSETESNFRSSFKCVQVPRIKAGRIGKRVRIPRGRATVNDFAESSVKQSQETCQNVAAAL
jgi:hypothetical protein